MAIGICMGGIASAYGFCFFYLSLIVHKGLSKQSVNYSCAEIQLLNIHV